MRASTLSPPTACTSGASARIESLVAARLEAGLASLRAGARELQDPAQRRDPEIIHRMRVAVRRMRAALGVFENPLGRRVAPVRLRRAQKALRALGRALGEARDWDVILTELLPARRAALEAALGRAALQPVARRARLQRLHANLAARRYAAGPEFSANLGRLGELRAALERYAAGPDTRPAASPQHALERQARRVQRLGARLVELDEHGRHRLRIEAKRLRYAIELCAPLLDAGGRKQWLRALRGLQDVLGDINNARVLVERLAPLEDGAGLRAELHAMARRTALRLLPQAAALFMAWRLARAPWKN